MWGVQRVMGWAARSIPPRRPGPTRRRRPEGIFSMLNRRDISTVSTPLAGVQGTAVPAWLFNSCQRHEWVISFTYTFLCLLIGYFSVKLRGTVFIRFFH